MKVAQQPQKPLSGSNQIWAMTSGKKDTATSEVTMYIATRRARLEARKAGFLVFKINKKSIHIAILFSGQ